MGNCGTTEAQVPPTEKNRPQPKPEVKSRQAPMTARERRQSVSSAHHQERRGSRPQMVRHNSIRRSSIGTTGPIRRIGSMGKGSGITTHRNVAALNLANLNNAVTNITPSLLPPGSPCSQGLSDSSAGGKSQMRVSTVAETFTSEGLIDYVGTYKLQSRVGVGSYGTVFAAIDETSNQRYAIKAFDKHSLSQKQLRLHVWPEAQILSVVCNRSKNIVNLRQVLESDRYIYLIMELIEGPTLQKLLRTEHLSEYRVKTYFKALMEAVAALHSMNVIHRDIKPENILLDTALDEVKLVDFGFACRFENGQLLRHPCGSPQYVAPEVIVSTDADDVIRYEPGPVDIWSAGATLYELLTGRAPFENNNRALSSKDRVKGLFELIQNVNYPKERLASVSFEARDLIEKMLVKDPNGRISAEEVLQHPWLNSSLSMGKRLSQSSVSSGGPVVVGDYTLGIPLGRDSIGTIHSCVGRGEVTYSLRVLDTPSPSSLSLLSKETELLSHIRSDYIQSTHEVFEDNGFWYGVSNFVPGDTLHKKITNRSIGTQMSHRLKYTHQLLSTLSFLHQQGVVHRQVNPHNIVVDEVNDRLVFVNFSSAERTGTVVSDHPNSEGATAPEVLGSESEYSVSASEDVFAMGVILYQLYEYGKIPSQPPVFKHTTNPDARKLLEGMLNQNPSERITSQQALRSRYLEGAAPAVSHSVSKGSVPGLESLKKYIQLPCDTNTGGLTSESSTTSLNGSSK
eukprot:TRINITY_DN5833_c0_g1_i1.p1 TRINITY_DN5833_c0_g1~~TRINITY_DN5833_c0_g1_i1.p1  ORF type:complete len:738 (+),score=125.34 TRINITY_DN5833_c0_g1_i1:113-2326(+)